MRWILCAPLLAFPALTALSAAALAMEGGVLLLAITLALTVASHDAARRARHSAPMPRLLGRLRPCAPPLLGIAPVSGWMFGQAQDGAALVTMALCTALTTLAALPAYHALVCTPEAR